MSRIRWATCALAVSLGVVTGCCNPCGRPWWFCPRGCCPDCCCCSEVVQVAPCCDGPCLGGCCPPAGEGCCSGPRTVIAAPNGAAVPAEGVPPLATPPRIAPQPQAQPTPYAPGNGNGVR